NAVGKVHGTAAPNSDVKLTAGWSSRTLKTKAASDGRWSMELETPSYGGPYTLKAVDRDGAKTLSNVLIGDVWVCGGQSNMEMPVKGFAGQPAHNTADLIAKTHPSRELRLFRQPRDWSTTEKDSLAGGEWTLATSRAVADFSVVGYVFGDYLQEALDIPVGLIQCCWSNSKIEAWMAPETFESEFTDVVLPENGQTEFGWLEGTPTLLYNAMVNPWDGFPAAGAIWYQGEANTPNPEPYKKLFPAMVDDWKHVFRNDSLPFYYVQLAPFYSDGEQWAKFRQVQNELLDEMPNIGMATTGDCGDSLFIHPPKKRPVGERLARLALENTYGRDGLQSNAPRARSAAFLPDDPKTIIVSFVNSADGLTPTRAALSGFEVVDAFGEVYPAEATTYGHDRVKITSPVKNPVEVRYGYHNFYEGSLYNNVGVPVAPFRLELPKRKKPALMWFDAEANIKRFSNPDSIDYYIDKIADLGFTHAAVCIRPITGYLLYDSELAPLYRGNYDDVNVDFDYLGKFIEAAHRRGIKVLASMNTFCAGHNYIDKGLIYDGHPDWASRVLDVDRGIIPITEQKDKYGAMVNPINPEYQDYIISVMKEIVTKYPEVDGIILDRVRYDGITADFSDLSRREFEKYIGQKVKRFPDDILKLEKIDDKGRFKVIPGKHYMKWIEWRTKTITDFMARARKEVKGAKPDAIFSTYTGAWYPSYYEVGVNFASNTYDPSKDFDWATPEYKNLGYAELIDLYTTGNYYTDITIEESRNNPNTVWNETDSEGHSGSWYCVEGSCKHLRDIMGDNDVLGGVLVDQLYFDKSRLPRAIEMNLRASDGLMIFDIVHIIKANLWKEIEDGMRAGGNIQ
ncbi:MAG: family 10 glycosylhydrolase, partial [Muribaculaceae bacterium]|nr:family 10 glycosylhydrolase [Muribaculaceae bacterium]